MAITVAAAQLRSTSEPAANLDLVTEWAERAAQAEADLVVFPEATMANFRTTLAEVAQPLDGPFVTGLREAARDVGLWLVAGVFEPADDGRVHNTAVATNGEDLHSYRKIHLYDSFGSQESRTVAPGHDLVTFEALGTTIGLATCYDVRFAEQFIGLRRAGAEVICLPTSWGDGPGKDEQWNLLVRARAMDAQAVLIGADQAGDPGRPDDEAERSKAPLGVGQSLVAGPFGAVLAQAGLEEELLVTEVDLDSVRRARSAIVMD